MKRLEILLLSAAVAISLAACNSKKDDTQSEIRPRATVQVAQATLGHIDDVVDATGSFTVVQDEVVKSAIAGEVTKVFVLEGDEVADGQPLAMILSQESYAAISGAAALLDRATTPSEKAQASRALQLARKTASTATVAAPFSGVIIHRFVTEGELVSQGENLFEEIDPSSEYFVADVPINDINSVRRGETAVITVPGIGMGPILGIVKAVNPATDPNTQSVQVRISLKSVPRTVTAGTFGNVSIKIGEVTSAVLVPKPAVYHNDELDRYFVWRIEGDSLALLTRVDVGLTDSTSVQITSGLRPGDVVATVGGYGLPDSTAVTVAGK